MRARAPTTTILRTPINRSFAARAVLTSAQQQRPSFLQRSAQSGTLGHYTTERTARADENLCSRAGPVPDWRTGAPGGRRKRPAKGGTRTDRAVGQTHLLDTCAVLCASCRTLPTVDALPRRRCRRATASRRIRTSRASHHGRESVAAVHRPCWPARCQVWATGRRCTRAISHSLVRRRCCWCSRPRLPPGPPRARPTPPDEDRVLNV